MLVLYGCVSLPSCLAVYFISLKVTSRRLLPPCNYYRGVLERMAALYPTSWSYIGGVLRDELGNQTMQFYYFHLAMGVHWRG